MNSQGEKRTVRGYVGRGRRTPGQLWQAPTFFLGLLALTLVAASAPFRLDPAFRQFRDELAAFRAKLAPGHADPDVLVAQAEDLLARLEPVSRLAGETHFLVGTAYFRKAEQQPNSESALWQMKAVEHLEKAAIHGLPEKDGPALSFRLGLMLYRLDRDLERALDLMARHVERGADHKAEGHGLLVQAYLRQKPPDLEAALAANQKQLERLDDLSGPAMMRARLDRAEILVQRNQRVEALRELDRIQLDKAPELRRPTRRLQIRCAEEEGQWRRALTWWKELLADAEAVPGGRGRILLAIGRCHVNDEPPDYDQAALAWQQAVTLGGPEAQAAALGLGELRLEIAPAAALEVWTQALKGVRSAQDFHNPYFALEQARDLFDQACRRVLEQGDFERAGQVAELYKRLALPGRAEECLALAAEAQAKQAQDLAAGATKERATILKEQSRTHYHQAGVAYEQAAALRGEASAANAYWRSAQCYVQAKDSARAVAVLGKLVRLEKNESRLAEGWFALAEAFQSQGQVDQAQQAYYKCIEYPTNPLAYRARYQLALREIERKNFDQALAILDQNLKAPSPDMDRDAHEKSLYKMASLLVQMQIFDKAAVYLNKATRDYPGNPNALAARDQLGVCYRKLAEQAERKLEELERAHATANLSEEKKIYLEEKRGHYRRARRDWLEQALASCQGLADELAETARQKPLTPTEVAYLRKALFALADGRFELNDYPLALERYQALQARYRGQAEGLVACYKIWGCVGAMVQTADLRRLAIDAAKKAVEAALADLAVMPADHPGFSGAPDVWTKALWETELRRIQMELQRLTAPAPPNVVGFP